MSSPVEPGEVGTGPGYPSSEEDRLSFGSLRRTVAAVVGTRFTSGNRIDVLRNGEQIFPAMLDAIRSARHKIEFVTFVYWTGRVADEMLRALAEQAAEGVRVRVLLDGWGSGPMPDDGPTRLREVGAEVEMFRPVPQWKFWRLDHRTHRKILVCDDEVAFFGGVGIASEWDGDPRTGPAWRDTHFRLRGPAVLDLRAIFLTDWRDTGHPIEYDDLKLPDSASAGDLAVSMIDGSAQIGLNEAQRVMEGLTLAAEQRLWIQTPYFNPDQVIIDHLLEAHERGVDVQIMIPGRHIDKPLSRTLGLARLEPLVDRGVTVWSYRPSMMHVKSILVDGALSFIGSVNFNRRSVVKDEENAAVVYDEGFTNQLEEHFAEDREHCDRILDVDQSLMEKAQVALLHPIRKDF